MGGAGIGSEGGGNGSGCGVGNGAGLGRGSGSGGDGLGSGIMFFMSSCLQWARWIERQVQTHRRAGRTGFATLRCMCSYSVRALLSSSRFTETSTRPR